MGDIPASVVAQIEHRVLALHYATAANVCQSAPDLETAERTLRKTSEHFKQLSTKEQSGD